MLKKKQKCLTLFLVLKKINLNIFILNKKGGLHLHYLLDFIKGIAIGAGAILPGISSGVICIIFGLYETLLNCILNFFRNIKHNFKILFPIATGIFCGAILFGNILKFLFYAYPLQTNFTFIGLILGSIPSLFKQVSQKQNLRISNFVYLFLSLAIGIFFVYLENTLKITSSSTEYSFLFLVLSGLLMSAGVIIPGISSTLILMLLGIYNSYLTAVSTLYLPFLFPLAIGLFIGSIFCMKLTKFLLDKFHTQTFFSIIGFTLGSILVLYPGFSFDLNGIISILSLLLGVFLANVFN